MSCISSSRARTIEGMPSRLDSTVVVNCFASRFDSSCTVPTRAFASVSLNFAILILVVHCNSTPFFSLPDYPSRDHFFAQGFRREFIPSHPRQAEPSASYLSTPPSGVLARRSITQPMPGYVENRALTCLFFSIRTFGGVRFLKKAAGFVSRRSPVSSLDYRETATLGLISCSGQTDNDVPY